MEFMCSMKMYAEKLSFFMQGGVFVSIRLQFVPCQILSKMYKLAFLVAFLDSCWIVVLISVECYLPWETDSQFSSFLALAGIRNWW